MKNIISILFFFFLAFCLTPTYSQILNTYKYENVVNTGSKTIFKDGISKTYYIENGISITTGISTSNLYGKYYSVNLSIENLTGKAFNFDPNSIIVYFVTFEDDKKTKIRSIKEQISGKVLSSEEYMRKVKNRQGFLSALKSFGETSNAQSAGYSTSQTVTKVNGYSNTYGSVNNYYLKSPVYVNSRSSISGSAVSTTQSYDGKAAYDAMENAKKEIKEYNEQLYQIKTELYQEYLKINTLEHQQRIVGNVLIEYQNVGRIEILVPVNGKYYSFIYGAGSPQMENLGGSEIVSNDNSVNELYNQAKSAFNNKLFLESLKFLDKALEIDPNNYEVLLKKGTTQAFTLMQYENAIKTFTSAIALNSTSSDLFYYRAYCHAQLGNIVVANKDLENSINLNSKNVNAILSLGLNKSAINDFVGSNQEYNRIIQIANANLNFVKNLGTVYNNIGYNYLKMNDLKQSMTYLNKALDIQPNSSFIWGSRAQLYYRLKEYKKAISDCTNGIQVEESGLSIGINSDPSQLYLYRALCFIELRKDKDACIDLEKAIIKGNQEASKLVTKICK